MHCNVICKHTWIGPILVLSLICSNIVYSGITGIAIGPTHLAAGREQREIENGTQNSASSIVKIDSCPCVISERLGGKINRSEKEYFRIFPGIVDFIEAKCFMDESGSASFVITRGDLGVSEDTVIVVNARAVEELVNLVEHFELVCADKHYINFKLISDFVELTTIRRVTERVVNVSSMDGREYDLRILHADDSSIVLWKGMGEYDWRLREINVIYLPYHMIRSISIRRGREYRNPLPYAVIGSLVGGAAGGLVGYAQGDDDDPGSWFPMTAADKAVCCAGCGGLLGCLAGGGIVFVSNLVKGKDERFEINGDYGTFKSLRPVINKNSMFRDKIPPELRTENGVRSGN